MNRHDRYVTLRGALAATLGLLLAAAGQAAPQGGEVVTGLGEITVDDALTRILQHSDSLAIDWHSFDIAAGETVRFEQPSVDAIALNRIVGGDPTAILGRLEANGRVALVNSRGIVFGETATVDVAGLIASGLDLDPQDVTAAEWRLAAVADDAGFVINRGTLEAAVGATLVGRQVTNEAGALIAADVVQLVGADAAVLTFDPAGLVGVAVDAAVAEGSALAAVINAGELSGGRILLEARVAGDVFANAVNHTGVVRAQGIDTSGGVIRLIGTGGDVRTGGTLDASSAALSGGVIEVAGDTTYVGGNLMAGGVTGGEISLGGARVALIDVVADASGRDGGGRIQVGERAGATATSAVYVGAGAELSADAVLSGDGGEVVIEAAGTTRFFGGVSVRGGAIGGDGGRVEAAAGEALMASGRVDTGAPLGSNGEYRLESAAIEVAAGVGTGDDANPFPPGSAGPLVDAAALGASLATGNVTLTAAGQLGVAADVDLDGSHGNMLSLLAGGELRVHDGVAIADTNAASADATRLTLRADGDVRLGAGSRIASGGAAVSLAGVDVDNFGLVDAGAGTVAIAVGRGGHDSDSSLGDLESAAGITVAGGAGDDVLRLSGRLSGASTTLDGGGGANRLVTTLAGQTFTLGAAPAEFSLPGITVGNVQRVDAAGSGNVLLGNGSGRDFTVSAGGPVTVNGVAFTGFDQVVGSGIDRLGAAGGGFALTGTDGEVDHQGIRFQGLGEVATGGGELSGTAGDDVFTGSGNGDEIRAAAIAFTGLGRVTGGGGSDALVLAAPGEVLGLTGAGTLSYRGIDLRELAAVDSDDAVLLGSPAADTFTLDDRGRLLAAGLSFGGLAAVHGDGAGSGDTLVLDSGDHELRLAGPDGFDHAGIRFRLLDRVAAGPGSNRLVGSDGDDTFRIVDARAVSARGIRFDGISTVAAGHGVDRVIGSAGSVFEAPAPNRVDSAGMAFHDVEQVDAGGIGSLLVGSAGDDRFALTGSRSLSFAGVRFDNLDRVDGAGGLNTVLGTPAAEHVTVSDSRRIHVAGLSFSAVDVMIGNGGDDLLTGGAADDRFELGSGPGELRYRDVLFQGWPQVDGGGGRNRVIGSAAAEHWQLTGQRSLDVHGIGFAGIDAVDGGGGADRLSGPDLGTEFLLAGDARVVSGAITFDGMLGGVVGGAGDDVFRLAADFSASYRVDGGAGRNRLIGHAGDEEFTLTGVDHRLGYGSAELSGIHAVDAGAGANRLQGSAAADHATLIGPGALAADGIEFSGLSQVAFGAGGGRLTAAPGGSDFTVTGADAVSVAGMTFAGVERLEGGAGDDRFTLQAGASLSAGIDGGGGHDRLAAQGAALDWRIASDGNRVDGTAFAAIETVADFSTTEFGLSSDFALAFHDGSWIGFSGGDAARFEYRAVDTMTVSASAVSGSGVVARALAIEAAGTVQLGTEVGSISVVAGGDIDITQAGRLELLRLVSQGGDVTVLTDGDQRVSAIDAGSGAVTLRSALGRLQVAEAAADRVQIAAGRIELDALLGIGTVERPFYLASDQAPRLSALEYVSPILTPGTPQPIAQGRRIASLAETVAASGLRSAVQPYALELVLIDPAIFTALLPFSIGSEAVALPGDDD